jgi:hypothetical protein
MIRTIGLSLLLVAAACGKKKETPASVPEAGPAKPNAPAAPALPVAIDAAPEPAGPPADAAVATVFPCTFATREEMEKVTGPWTTDPKPLDASASILGGCSFELANRYITIEARPIAELSTLVPQKKTSKERDFPPKTTGTTNADTGDVYVTFEGKTYVLHVHADAGENNPDVKLAKRLAVLLAKGAK